MLWYVMLCYAMLGYVMLCCAALLCVERFARVKHQKAEGLMDRALTDLADLARELSGDETSLKVKCLLKVTQPPHT